MLRVLLAVFALFFTIIGVHAETEPTRLTGISTRGAVLTGDNVLIAGFIIGGSTPKSVVVRARGPSLGLGGHLADPVLTLVPADGSPATANDDWQTASNAAELQATGFQPGDPKESAIMATLVPGAYTAIVTGTGDSTGIGLVEVYELGQPESPALAISTRGLVQPGDSVLIGGFIIQGSTPLTVVVRARGPSLGLASTLADPTVMISAVDGSNYWSNDDWQTYSNASELEAGGMQPGDPKESALMVTLPPGAYTTIVTGGGIVFGAAIIEIFAR